MKHPNQEPVWNQIAEWWEIYRKHSLDEIEKFLKNKTGKILDLGCGNGRNFNPNKGTIYGVDFSKKMLEHAKQNAKQRNIKVILKKADATKLPFKNNFFDSAIAIALLHCIPGQEKKQAVLKELNRVLKPKAKLLITVWDKNQARFKDFPKEGYRNWKSNNKTFKRYNYLFEKQELIDLLKEAEFKTTKVLQDSQKTKFGRKNMILYCEKV